MNDAKYIASLLSQPAPRRYEHFIKRAADHEEVWGLYKDGWAMASTNDGRQVFPVWPAKEFAELCATGDWAGCAPREMSVYDFMEDVLPTLQDEHAEVGVFSTPQDKGVVPTIDRLLEDLRTELHRF